MLSSMARAGGVDTSSAGSAQVNNVTDGAAKSSSRSAFGRLSLKSTAGAGSGRRASSKPERKSSLGKCRTSVDERACLYSMCPFAQFIYPTAPTHDLCLAAWRTCPGLSTMNFPCVIVLIRICLFRYGSYI